MNAQATATIRAQHPLSQALSAETELIGSLRTALWHQRAGVAESDPAKVETATMAIARIAVAMGQVRKERFSLIDAITGSGVSGLDAAIEALPVEFRPALEHVRDRLRDEIVAATQDATITQLVLRRALQSGEAFLQQLFSMRKLDYDSSGAPDSLLFDRTA